MPELNPYEAPQSEALPLAKSAPEPERVSPYRSLLDAMLMVQGVALLLFVVFVARAAPRDESLARVMPIFAGLIGLLCVTLVVLGILCRRWVLVTAQVLLLLFIVAMFA